MRITIARLAWGFQFYQYWAMRFCDRIVCEAFKLHVDFRYQLGRAMPARDVYHDTVIHALEADGWRITHDPLTISYGGRDLYVDLGAEHTTIAAEKPGRKIAVEIKSFLGQSPVQDFEQAIGQYEVYRSVLAAIEPDRQIYLAVPQRVNEGLLTERFGQLLLNSLQLCLIIFDEQQERITTWIP